jgi:hypothetical protein
MLVVHLHQIVKVDIFYDVISLNHQLFYWKPVTLLSSILFVSFLV